MVVKATVPTIITGVVAFVFCESECMVIALFDFWSAEFRLSLSLFVMDCNWLLT